MKSPRFAELFSRAGDSFSSRAGYVNWSSVCTPKSAGGLGVRNTFLWNIAALGKYVWAVEKKIDNQGVKWVHVVYIQQDLWWDYVPKNTSSWYWRQVCSAKEKLKGFFTQVRLQQMQHYSITYVYKKLSGEYE